MRYRAVALVWMLTLAIVSAPAAALAGSAAEIDAKVDQALETLFADTPEAKDLANASVAVLVFPEIVKGGVILGGEYGEGALRQGGKTLGYFSIAAASFGLQLGGQTFGQALFFLNEQAMTYLKDVKGFELGVGPTLVGGDQGWSKSMGTNDLQGDIAVVFFGQKGVMAGGGIKGSKISRIERE